MKQRAFNPIFATGGCMVAQVPENQGWLGKGVAKALDWSLSQLFKGL
jgi:hypothetical protein